MWFFKEFLGPGIASNGEKENNQSSHEIRHELVQLLPGLDELLPGSDVLGPSVRFAPVEDTVALHADLKSLEVPSGAGVGLNSQSPPATPALSGVENL